MVKIKLFVGRGCRPNLHDKTLVIYMTHASKPEQEVGALGATIKKRREELQEVTHTNAVEMDSIKTKAAEAVARAKEDHEKKVRAVSRAAGCFSGRLAQLLDSVSWKHIPLRYFQDALGVSFFDPKFGRSRHDWSCPRGSSIILQLSGKLHCTLCARIHRPARNSRRAIPSSFLP